VLASLIRAVFDFSSDPVHRGYDLPNREDASFAFARYGAACVSRAPAASEAACRERRGTAELGLRLDAPTTCFLTNASRKPNGGLADTTRSPCCNTGKLGLGV